MARGRRLGARAGAGRRIARDGRRGDRARRRGPARRRLPQHVRPGARRRAASTATCSGATSCTASATSSRRRSPGTGRSATTGCSHVAARAADSVDRELGPGGRDGDRRPPRDRDGARRAVPGRPASARYLDLAASSTSTGAATGCSGPGRFGAAYWQDHAAGPRGAGRGRSRRPPAVPRLRRGRRRRRDRRRGAARRGPRAAGGTWSRRGPTSPAALGSRHKDEAFGDPFELPPDRAYAETCAAIASVMLAWRLLLATGDPDVRRRRSSGRSTTASCPGVSRDGNAVLLRQPAPAPDAPGRGRRRATGERAAVVRLRLLPAEPDADARVAGRRSSRRPTADGHPGPPVRGRRDRGRRRRRPGPAGRRDRLSVERPGRGRRSWRRPRPTVDAALRVPGWATAATIDWAAGDATAVAAGDRDGRTRPARGGPATPSTSSSTMPARITEPAPAGRRDPRLRRARARAARLRDRDRRPPGRRRASRTSRLDRRRRRRAGRAPRPRARASIGLVGRGDDRGRPTALDLAAIPYYAWANRSVEAMRVWIPRTDLPGSTATRG